MAGMLEYTLKDKGLTLRDIPMFIPPSSFLSQRYSHSQESSAVLSTV